MEHEPVSAITNRVARAAFDAAFTVHRHFGPGLLESAYEHCLEHELLERGLRVERQVALPIVYKGLELEAGYRLDLLVERRVILEIKTVEALAPVHTAQLLTYLRLSGVRLGYLINFNVPMLKDGIKRIVL